MRSSRYPITGSSRSALVTPFSLQLRLVPPGAGTGPRARKQTQSFAVLAIPTIRATQAGL